MTSKPYRSLFLASAAIVTATTAALVLRHIGQAPERLPTPTISSQEEILRAGIAHHNVDLSLINPSDITHRIEVEGVHLAATAGAGIVLVETPGLTITFSDSYHVATLSSHDIALIGSPHGGDNINVAPAMSTITHNSITLSGGRNNINFVPSIINQQYILPTNIIIAGFTPGSDHLNLPSIAEVQPIVKTIIKNQAAPSVSQVARMGLGPIFPTILKPTPNTPIDGHRLDFSRQAIVLNIGDVGDGSPNAVATALNKIYRTSGKKADATQTSPATIAGEAFAVIGDSPSGLVIYQCGLFAFMQFGDQIRAIPNGLETNNTDHKIEITSLHHLATLSGITSDRLTPHDFE